MVTIRTSAEIPEDRRLVVNLPPETPLGEAELVITVAPKSDDEIAEKSVSDFFGVVRGDDPSAADNERIDCDLGQAYGEANS